MEYSPDMDIKQYSEYLRGESETLLRPLILKYEDHPSHVLGVLGTSLMIIGCQLKDPDIFKRMLGQMIDNVDAQSALIAQHEKEMDEG